MFMIYFRCRLYLFNPTFCIYAPVRETFVEIKNDDSRADLYPRTKYLDVVGYVFDLYVAAFDCYTC